MSFILPSAQCDLNLNTHTKGWLNCIIFIGKKCVYFVKMGFAALLCDKHYNVQINVEIFLSLFQYVFEPQFIRGFNRHQFGDNDFSRTVRTFSLWKHVHKILIF